MRSVTLRHSDAGRGEKIEVVSSFDDLLNRMESLSQEYRGLVPIPYTVDLVLDDDVMSVGLGQDEWILSLTPADEGPSKYSMGDAQAEGSASFFFGDHTLMSRKYLVPKQLGIEAVREWCDDKILSAKIDWTEEIF